MHRDPQEKVWPYIVLMLCLLGLSMLAPRYWHWRDRQQMAQSPHRWPAPAESKHPRAAQPRQPAAQISKAVVAAPPAVHPQAEETPAPAAAPRWNVDDLFTVQYDGRPVGLIEPPAALVARMNLGRQTPSDVSHVATEAGAAAAPRRAADVAALSPANVADSQDVAAGGRAASFGPPVANRVVG
ncbi:MAG: hypothetical protein KDA41_06105, partial [Planctomycetales bacterium]|nr:hypothetical protein [Planctomycetales bacterium]